MINHPRRSVLMFSPVADEREMYAEYLRSCGFDVLAYEHAEDAIRGATTAAPDVVVTRLRQSRPGPSGIDFVRRVRGTAATHRVPVVVITTSMLARDRDAADDARCDAYLLLPVTPDELVSEIQRVLSTDVVSSPATRRARG